MLNAQRWAAIYKDVWYNKDALGKAAFQYGADSILSILSNANTIYNMGAITAHRNPDADKQDAEYLTFTDEDRDNPKPGFNKDGYIIDQRALVDGNKRNVGYALGSSPANGCGWISAYNALKMLTDEVDENGKVVSHVNAYEVMREVEMGALALGTAGTDPIFLRNYFILKGYDAKIYFAKEDVEKEAPHAKANIWVYGWYSYDNQAQTGTIGAHFVACKPVNGNAKPSGNGSDQMIFYNSGKGDEANIPLQEHYLDTDFFRFMICIN